MKRTMFLLLAMVIMVGFVGCKYVQINPTSDASKYEVFGNDLGVYYKTADPEFVAKAKPYITGALALSDEELISADVLQTAYKYAMEQRPNDAAAILLIKSGINLFGIKLDASKLAPEELPGYAKSSRALLKGFLAGIK